MGLPSSCFFLKEGEGLSPNDAALPATSTGTRYEPNPMGKFGVNVDVEWRSRGSEAIHQRMREVD